MENRGPFTCQAGADLEGSRRVKVDATASGTANFPVVVYAGVDEAFIGVTEYSAKSGEKLSVRPRYSDGLLEIVAAGVIAIGSDVHGAADGQIADTGTAVQGVAMKAAAAAGEAIPVAVV